MAVQETALERRNFKSVRLMLLAITPFKDSSYLEKALVCLVPGAETACGLKNLS